MGKERKQKHLILHGLHHGRVDGARIGDVDAESLPPHAIFCRKAMRRAAHSELLRASGRRSCKETQRPKADERSSDTDCRAEDVRTHHQLLQRRMTHHHHRRYHHPRFFFLYLASSFSPSPSPFLRSGGFWPRILGKVM